MLSFIKFLQKIVRKTPVLPLILSLILGLFGFLGESIDRLAGSPPQELVASQTLLFLDSYTHSQDVATDGQNYYFSSRFSLIKTELDGESLLAINLDAIPKDLKDKYGSAHIGGISYHDGKIYAALEDSKVWNYPIVALYDAESLEYTGQYHILSAEFQQKGLAWIAVDSERGLIYSAQRDHSPQLIAYDLETFELVKTIDLSQNPHRIQGGDMHKGILYVATQDETQAVYSINPENGEVRKCFDQNLPKGGEAEGLTVLETDDGALLHTLDLGPLFINAFFRHYSLSQ